MEAKGTNALDFRAFRVLSPEGAVTGGGLNTDLNQTRREAGPPAHSGALEAIFLCSGAPGARLPLATTPSLFIVSPSMRSPRGEEKGQWAKRGARQ